MFFVPTFRGLAWGTDDSRLRQVFEEFGTVEEAVRVPSLKHDTSSSMY